LFLGDFSDSFTELLEGVDEGRWISDHSAGAFPTLFFILVSDGFKYHDSDTKSRYLLWRFG
jgi:hypothetical protein